MIIDELKKVIHDRYSNWNVYFEESGVAIWISMNDGESHFFEIQVTPNDGVGVSIRRDVEELDFSGHDEAFNSLDEALDYVDRQVRE